MRKLALIFVLALAVLVGAAPTLAATNPAVSITRATLTARVMVTVKFDVVCQPIFDYLFPDGTTAGSISSVVTIDQASGRSIAHASAGNIMPSGQPNATCDGLTVNHLSISAVSSTVPFHGGAAVVSLSAAVDDPACPFCAFQRVDLAPVTVTLR